VKPIKLKCTNFHLRAKMSEDRFSYEVSREQWEMEHDPAYNKWLDNNAQWWADYDLATPSPMARHFDTNRHAQLWADYDRKLEKIMPLNVSDKGGSFTPVPQGTHVAVCNMIVDLGMQETPFGNKHQLYVRWELPNERLEYGEEKKEGPMVVGKFYTASLNEKANLRHDLEAWRGRAFTGEELSEFDVFTVLGIPCQLTVTHNDAGKAKVAGVTGIPKGMDKPKAENPLVKYSEPGDESQWDLVPKWLQDIVMKGVSEKVPVSQVDTDTSFDQSIPF